MNTSQYMDKQIMDLAASTNAQTQSRVFIDLMKHPEEDPRSDTNVSGGGVEEVDGVRAEEIVPSYDFQPIRPVSTGVSSSPKSMSLEGGSSAGAWNSVDSKTNPNVPIRNYSSLDSSEPAKTIPGKDQQAHDVSVVSVIDKTMKKHIDNLLNLLEAVSARLVHLESRTHNLENSVDDLKVATGNNHGNTDGKMRQLESILIEVQKGVQAIKDKQETMESQLQIANLHISKPGQPHEPHNPDHVDSGQPLPSRPHHSHTRHPPPSSVPYQQSLPSLPPPASQQIPPPSIPVPNQFPNPSIPQQEPYLPQPPPSQPQEANQPYPAAQQHQLYPPPQHPPQPQPTHSHYPDKPPYKNYPPPSTHQPPPAQPPPAQHSYGGYEPPPGRPSHGFSSDPYGYGGSSPPQYGSNSPVKNPRNGGSGYPQLPTARVLPQALPACSGLTSRSGSSGTGNNSSVHVDDVVDRVTSMGFPRDQARAAVRKLTENGQAVDLNMVLDKLMNDSDVQPPRGWFGR